MAKRELYRRERLLYAIVFPFLVLGLITVIPAVTYWVITGVDYRDLFDGKKWGVPEYYWLILLLLTLSCCEAVPRREDEKQNFIYSDHGGKYTVVVIDGCEYLVHEFSHPGYETYSFSFTHKGNCKSKVHFK
jgi:hypothetical protein